MMLDEQTIEKVRAIPVSDVLSKHIEIKKNKALCPFHDEKTPSFSVNDAKGIYKCFGCGATGDGIKFVMNHSNLSFVDAVKSIAKDQGIPIEEKPLTPEQQAEHEAKHTIYIMNALAAEFYQEQLPNNAPAKTYAEERINVDLHSQMRLGYAPKGKQLIGHLQKAGYTLEQITEAGLANNAGYDFFQDRIIFPIFSNTNNIVGFSGRNLTDEKPKYLNTHDNKVFHKSSILYGYNWAQSEIKKQGYCVLVEGYTDWARMWSKGVNNVVAVMGTSFTDQHAAMIRNLVPEVVILTDGDEAGQKSAGKIAEQLTDTTVRYYPLPDDQDPDQYFSENEFNKADAKLLAQYFAETELEGIKEKDPLEKTEAIKAAANYITTIKDSTLAESVIDEIQKGIGKKDADLIRKEYKDIGQKRDATKENQSSKNISELEKIENYLNEKYEFRYNIISNDVEYLDKDDEDATWSNLKTQTIWRELQKKLYKVSTSNLDALFSSDFVYDFNPFHEYFNNIGDWDPENEPDYIGLFAEKITAKNPERFKQQFKKHLVRTVVCAINENFFNKQCFVLISSEQNIGKTTMLRYLVPDALKPYYTENMDLSNNQKKDSDITLSSNFIINMDELATLGKSDIKQLKARFSYTKIKARHPYGRKPIITIRTASFFASTNEYDFLTDESGSVRWLCFEIEKIDFTYEKIKKDDIWRQAYNLYKKGLIKYELTKDEIDENEKANLLYQNDSPELDLINKYFLPGKKDEPEETLFMTSTEIRKVILEQYNSSVTLYPNTLAKKLQQLGFARSSDRRIDIGDNSFRGYYVKFKNKDLYDKVVLDHGIAKLDAKSNSNENANDDKNANNYEENKNLLTTLTTDDENGLPF